MSDITYKQSYTEKFPLHKCLQVQVDRIWQVVGGCARSKQNPTRKRRAYRQTLSAPIGRIHVCFSPASRPVEINVYELIYRSCLR
jgi:hypothetical protein